MALDKCEKVKRRSKRLNFLEKGEHEVPLQPTSPHRKPRVKRVVAPMSPKKETVVDSKGSLSRKVEGSLRGAFQHVIGVDEAGRGPLAGPVVAAACWVADGVEFDGIMDSKKMTQESVREEVYARLVAHPEVRFAVSIQAHTVIDDINILQATMRAMRLATEDLLKKGGHAIVAHESIALVDGNRAPENMPTAEARFVIKGDASVFSIAAASVVAKVTRDRLMHALDKEFPQYGFSQHKGYGTAMHMQALHTHGPCPVHRLTYAPVRKSFEQHANAIASAPPSAKD